MDMVWALWRGDIPLAKTGGIFGLLVLGLLICALLYVTGLHLPKAYAPVTAGLSASILGYSAFIAIAIWRSASKYRGPAAWRWLAKGSVLFVALQVIVGFGIA